MPDGLFLLVVVVGYLVYKLFESIFNDEDSNSVNESRNIVRNYRDSIVNSNIRKLSQSSEIIMVLYERYTTEFELSKKGYKKILKIASEDGSHEIIGTSSFYHLKFLMGSLFLLIFMYYMQSQNNFWEEADLFAKIFSSTSYLALIFLIIYFIRKSLHCSSKFGCESIFFIDDYLIIKFSKIYMIPKDKIKKIFINRTGVAENHRHYINIEVNGINNDISFDVDQFGEKVIWLFETNDFEVINECTCSYEF